MPQAFFLKLSNIMFVAAAMAVPQDTFDSLYRPLGVETVHKKYHKPTMCLCAIVFGISVAIRAARYLLATNWVGVCATVFARSDCTGLPFEVSG